VLQVLHSLVYVFLVVKLSFTGCAVGTYFPERNHTLEERGTNV
jgi:hypothetical protein